MVKVTRRSKEPRKTEGPTVAAFGERDGTLTIRVLGEKERAPRSRFVVKAAGEGRAEISAAVAEVAKRIKVHATRPVVVTVLA